MIDFASLYLRTVQRLASALIGKADRRAPDFVIPNDQGIYLRRWWLLPRNPLFNVYLHEICGNDEDRALHDHPWPSLSLTLRGAYVEVLPTQPQRSSSWDYMPGFTTAKLRVTGALVWRSPWLRHRLETSPDSGRTFTLFITGPVLREWGFHCRNGWVPWRNFLADGDKTTVGAGCEGAPRPGLSLRRIWRGEDA